VVNKDISYKILVKIGILVLQIYFETTNMTSSGQSIGDRLAAAQHTIVGSDLTKSVLKASTTEVMGPKKKHLEYLQALTSNPNINIVELADSIVERTKNNKWVVVFKALITTHHLTCFGHERFLQHLASRNTLFNLSTFQDKSGVQGYDMSAYIRKYAKYLNEKAISYRMVAYDFTRVKRGKDESQLKMLTSEKLLKTLPIIQQQLDALLEFDPRSNELTNGVINAAFYMLFKDLIRLFASYNDGIINLLEKFFGMKKQQCKEGLELYKKFLTRTIKVSELLKVAEQVGIDKGDIPDLTKAPKSLLDALSQHIAGMEGKKFGKGNANKAGTPIHAPTKSPNNNAESKEAVQAKAVAEEAEIFNQLMSANSHQSKPAETIFSSTNPSTATTNAFSSGLQQIDLLTSSPSTKWPTSTTQNDKVEDLFGGNFIQPSQPAQAPASWTNNDDLFGSSDLLKPISLNGQMPAQQQIPSNGNQVTDTSLEASMANVLANLNITGSQKPNQTFGPMTQPKLTGGNNFQVNTPAMTTMQSMPPTFVPMQQPAYGMMRPPAYGSQVQMMNFTGMVPMQQPVNHANMYMQPQQQVLNPFQVQQPAQPSQTSINPNNPFGSLM